MKLIIFLLFASVSLAAFADEKDASHCLDLRTKLKNIDSQQQQPQSGQQPQSDPVADSLKLQKSALQDEMKKLDCNPF